MRPSPRRGSAIVLSALAALSGCTGGDPAPAAAREESPEERRRGRCEQLARDTSRAARITGAGLIVGLGGADRMDGRAAGELAAMGDALAGELVARCMTWPEDVIDCLGPLGMLANGCEAKLDAALGTAEAKPPASVPAGPAPAWSLALGERRPADLLVARDGTVVALVEGELVAARAGAIAWRRDGGYGTWLAEGPGDSPTALAPRDDRIVAVDLADGRERWSVALPAVPEADEYDGPPRARTIAREPGADSFLVGDSAARFFRLRPGRCAAGKKPPKDCLTPAGALAGEVLEDDARLLLAADGRRFLRERGVVRGFDADWYATMTARAHDALGAVALAPDGLVVLVDEDVVLLDPARCGGDPFAPSGWPQPGRLYSRQLDECPDCAAPPPGCRLWRVHLAELHDERPAVQGDGAVIVHADGQTRALRAGAIAWTAVTGGGGPLLRLGDLVLGVSTGLADDDPLAVYALGGDGEHRWRSPLPITLPGLLYSIDDILLAHGGGWLVAGYRGTVAALPLPEPTGPG